MSTGSLVQKIDAKDDFIQIKLSEINDIFKDVYNDNLTNIVDTLAEFVNLMNQSNDKSVKKAYSDAINKLLELKNIYMLRYKWILDNVSL